MLTLTERPVTIQDFLKLKKYKPWSGWRQTAKTINFSLLFGCSAGTFAKLLDQNGFTIDDAEELIRDAHLEAKLKDKANDPKAFSKGPKFCKMLVCAEFMKENFFKTYVGLDSRLTREIDFALEHGYIRSWHGPVRHVPELLLMRISDKGYLIGNDKDNYSKLFSDLKKVAGNSGIQTLEAAIAFPAIHEICSYIKEWKLQSFIFNMIHDSIDLCVYKPEEELVLALVNQCMTKFRYFDHGIPMESDGDLVDLSNLEDQYFKHGKDAKVVDIQTALKNHNEKYGTAFVYDAARYL
jgi:DNA polymerase I-like protein with 3'-5' exonuclease and polymerase domains